MCPHAAGTRGVRAWNGGQILWDFLLYSKCCILIKIHFYFQTISAGDETVDFSTYQVGDDKTIKQWKMETPGYGEEEEPLNTILGKVWPL